MKHELITKQILHKLGGNKKCIGYRFIIYAIELISDDEDILHDLNKILYADISRKFHATTTSVEKNIRYVIVKLWENMNEHNMLLFLDVFGSEYTFSKPSSKIFLEYLYEYVKRYDILSDIFTEEYKCPILNVECNVLNEVIKRLLKS